MLHKRGNWSWKSSLSLSSKNHSVILHAAGVLQEQTVASVAEASGLRETSAGDVGKRGCGRWNFFFGIRIAFLYHMNISCLHSSKNDNSKEFSPSKMLISFLIIS